MDLGEKLVQERRARLAAERMLELKSRELFAANRKLAEHARALSEEIIIQRRVVQDATTVAEELRGENARVRSDLDTATQARTVAEHRLWLALETIRDGFAIYDAEERLVVANSAYLSIFEGLEEVGPGAHARDILRIGMEEGVFDPGERTPGEWIDWVLGRWRQDPIEPCVIRLWNGRYIRLVDRRGNDGGVVCLALDITEAVRRERQLREARARAEAASRAKSAFLANMSHELRTPMNGVVGMAELLAETSLTEEQRLYAETIRSSGEALLLIINDVLDYSKLEAEKLTLRPVPFDLERLLHEVATLLTPRASAKGLTIALDVDPLLPAAVVGDPGRLRQVLTNLAGNAVKFTERGHVVIRAAPADAASGRAGVTLSVEDTGIGIAPEMQAHIFGEFNQVEDDRSRRYEGTGLGLAISRRLVRLMGGDILVDSDLGRGARFTFTVDLPPAPGAAPVAPPLPDPALRRVAVAEADAVQRAILAGQLRRLGLDVAEIGPPPGGATAAEPAEEGAADAGGARAGAEGFDAVFADAAFAAALAAPRPGRGDPLPLVLLAGPAAPAGPLPPAAVARLVRPALRDQLLAAVGADAGAAAACGRHRAPAVAPRRSPAGRIRVLAAEDNRTNQLVFAKMLKDLPLDITFAGTGREAVELHAELRPDIVFMDISMPEMDGREATRRIRAAEAAEGAGRTPVVALTAHALEGDREEVLAAGADLYLTKPLRKSAILEALAACLPGFAAGPGTPDPAVAEAPGDAGNAGDAGGGGEGVAAAGAGGTARARRA
ncbi:MAG: ATP-binding protein [Rhodobacteraceae bacterium]|nr:ATP-binding protein [Paracoccaceae bacterium]